MLLNVCCSLLESVVPFAHSLSICFAGRSLIEPAIILCSGGIKSDGKWQRPNELYQHAPWSAVTRRCNLSVVAPWFALWKLSGWNVASKNMPGGKILFPERILNVLVTLPTFSVQRKRRVRKPREFFVLFSWKTNAKIVFFPFRLLGILKQSFG